MLHTILYLLYLHWAISNHGTEPAHIMDKNVQFGISVRVGVVGFQSRLVSVHLEHSLYWRHNVSLGWWKLTLPWTCSAGRSMHWVIYGYKTSLNHSYRANCRDRPNMGTNTNKRRSWLQQLWGLGGHSNYIIQGNYSFICLDILKNVWNLKS